MITIIDYEYVKLWIPLKRNRIY